jgi:hypothetical protein
MERSEKPDHRRIQRVVAEEHAAECPDRCEHEERNDEPLFLRVQARRDEVSNLIHDKRRGKHDTSDERDIEVEGEVFARPDENELTAWRQHSQGRLEDRVGDAIDEQKGDEHAGGDRETGANDALPEFVELLQKAHFVFAKIILRFLRRQLKVSFGHDDPIVDTHWPFAREQTALLPTA